MYGYGMQFSLWCEACKTKMIIVLKSSVCEPEHKIKESIISYFIFYFFQRKTAFSINYHTQHTFYIKGT